MGMYHRHAVRSAERRQAAALERVALVQTTDVERIRQEAYNDGYRAGHLAGWRACLHAVRAQASRTLPQPTPPPTCPAVGVR